MKKLKSKLQKGIVVLKNGRVWNSSKKSLQNMDVVLKDGKIDKIGKIKDKIAKGTVVDLKKSYVLPGLIDIHVHLREPGFEEKETIESGCAAAAVGGFTAVCSMPNTDPVTDNQETVRFIKEKAANQLVDVYPIGAVTKGSKGEELAEIGYMHGAGIVGISDDGIPILNSKIMRLSLEYCKKFGIPVISHAEEKELTATGCMNEGFQSTKLGLRGMPSVAEDIMVARDIMLAEFTGGKVHIAHVSTAASVELVRKAKAKGISVTAEAAPHHFTLTDKACETYDSYFKMNPPLRTKKDMSAIIKGLKDGTIDTIATDHAPHHTDVKEGEFDQAAFGVTGLETAIGVYFTELVDKHGFDDVKGLIDKFVVNPRKVINIDVPEIKEGMAAEISIIDPSQKWIVDKKEFCSRSENSCFLGKKLRGKPVGVVNKKRIWLNTY